MAGYYGDDVTVAVLDPNGFEEALNRIAAEGWRLVSIERVVINEAKGDRLCIFERVSE